MTVSWRETLWGHFEDRLTGDQIDDLARYVEDGTKQLVEHERDRCLLAVAEQRCERGTTWDLAIVTAMNAIKPGSAEWKRSESAEVSAPLLLAALKNLRMCAQAIVGADINDPEADEAFEMYFNAQNEAHRVIAKMEASKHLPERSTP